MNVKVTVDENSATSIKARCDRPRHDRANNWFSSLVAELWPVKGSAAIVQYTAVPDRTARAYSSGHREPPASVLRDLLRGDEGFRVLTWLLVGFTPTWWINVQAEMHFAKRAREILDQLDCLKSARV